MAAGGKGAGANDHQEQREQGGMRASIGGHGRISFVVVGWRSLSRSTARSSDL
jgi:hypothetical protein